jgi:hypothetical protein
LSFRRERRRVPEAGDPAAKGYEGELGQRLNNLLRNAGLSSMLLTIRTTQNGVTTKQDHILDYPLSSGANWYRINPDGSVTAINNIPQLNSSGTPVTFVNPK